MMRLIFASLLLLSSSVTFAQTDQLGLPEMREMFNADQAARTDDSADWEEVSKADAARRQRVRDLLDAGQLSTAHDFYAAAFIFQHGSQPEDYLLAHALAIRSLGLGMKEAEWIAAATLDRYLHSTSTAQIYGTQFQSGPEDETWTQGRFAPDLLTDQIRKGAGVETLEEQRSRLETMNAAQTNPD